MKIRLIQEFSAKNIKKKTAYQKPLVI